MAVLKWIAKVIDTINEYLGRVFMLGALAIMVVIVIEVVSRYFFHSPTIWAYELMIMIEACYVILISAFGLLRGAYVCVDVVTGRFSQTTQDIIKLITHLIFLFPFVFLLVPYAWNFFIDSYTSGETLYSMWVVPVWPKKIGLAIGLTLLAAQAVSEECKLIIRIYEHFKEKKNLPPSAEEGVQA
jgi:TRAP-type mannitol/chloroaromatic compound transport system permease small subunit